MRIGDLSCWGTYRFLKDMFGDKKEISSCLCVKNLTHSSHHSDLGLSENRVSLNLLVNHHVRYSCRTFYYGIANVQTDPHYGWYPKKITIYIIPFITSVNMHLWYNMVSHLLGVFFCSMLQVDLKSTQSLSAAKALRELWIICTLYNIPCTAAASPPKSRDPQATTWRVLGKKWFGRTQVRERSIWRCFSVVNLWTTFFADYLYFILYICIHIHSINIYYIHIYYIHIYICVCT